MRWVSYILLAYLITAIHLGLAGFLNWGQAAPNLVLPVAVFIAINAGREEALLGVFLLGLLQDLFTHQPMGLNAFSYSLAALFVVGAQPAVYRDHPLTHLFVTLAAALVIGGAGIFNEWAYPLLHGQAGVSPGWMGALLSAVYSAALAPVILYPLVRVKWIFGFRHDRHDRMHRA